MSQQLWIIIAMKPAQLQLGLNFAIAENKSYLMKIYLQSLPGTKAIKQSTIYHTDTSSKK
jgi:hypothetical protein